MKRLLLILTYMVVTFPVFCQVHQSLFAKNMNATERLYIRGRRIDSISIEPDMGGVNASFIVMPTQKAVYDFVTARSYTLGNATLEGGADSLLTNPSAGVIKSKRVDLQVTAGSPIGIAENHTINTLVYVLSADTAGTGGNLASWAALRDTAAAIRADMGGGGGSYTFRYSLTESGGNVNLVGDVSSPGNWKVYGTNGSGTREWRDAATQVYSEQTTGSVNETITVSVPDNTTARWVFHFIGFDFANARHYHVWKWAVLDKISGTLTWSGLQTSGMPADDITAGAFFSADAAIVSNNIDITLTAIAATVDWKVIILNSDFITIFP